jgi:hypothetical protein
VRVGAVLRWSAMAALVGVTAVLALVTVSVAILVRDTGPDRAVSAELAVMGERLDAGAGERAQRMFPEGYLFAWVLFGLAAGNEVHRSEGPGASSAEPGGPPAALGAARSQAVERAVSPAGAAAFSPSLTPPYGVFHAAWTLLLRADATNADPLTTSDPAGRAALLADADRLAGAFAANLDAGRSPFLMAYPGQSWPVDSVVAMAALRTVDRAAGTDHGPLIDRWIARAGELVDPGTGLLPHVTDPVTGAMVQGARGTSQAIIQSFWAIVDPAGAPAVYARFREHFVTSVLGVVGIREYPGGVDGAGDVDSGPLVLGVSASASTVAIGAARANGDTGLAAALTQEVEALNGDRIVAYPFGLVPPADGFAAWARSVPVGAAHEQPGPAVWWPLWLALPWSVVIGAWWLVIRRHRSRPASAGGSPPPPPWPVGSPPPP